MRATSATTALAGRKLADAKGFPKAGTLCALCEDLRKVHDEAWGVALLQSAVAERTPVARGACCTLKAEPGELGLEWVLFYNRTHNGYLYCQGRREQQQYESRKSRCSQQVWPRIRGSSKRKPISLPRWILACGSGPPPGDKPDVSHLCGNSRCLRLSHLVWESVGANRRRGAQEMHKIRRGQLRFDGL